MNTESTNQLEEVFSELRCWLEHQIEAEKKLPDESCIADYFSEKLLELDRLRQDWSNYGVSAKNINERVRLLLEVSQKEFRISKPSNLKHFERSLLSIERTDIPDISFFFHQIMATVIRHDLLLLVQQPDGVSYFSDLFSDWCPWDDGEPSNATMWRVWATYFQEHANDPSTYLLRASVRYRLLEEKPYDPDDEQIEIMCDNHIKSSEYNRQYVTNALTDESVRELQAKYAEEKNIRARYKSLNQQRNPASLPTRKKIDQDVAEAIRLSGNDPKIKATGILIRPQPLIHELHQLNAGRQYKTLKNRAIACLQEIANYMEVSGITNLSCRKADLEQLCFHYLLSATFSTKADTTPISLFNYLVETNFKHLLDPSRSSHDQHSEIGGFVEESMRHIVEQCAPSFFADMLYALRRTGIDGLLLNFKSFWKSYEATHDSRALDSIDTEPIAEVLSAYPGYQGTLAKTIEQDGKDLFAAKLKVALLEQMPCDIYSIPKTINRLYCRLVEQRMEQHAEEKYRARLDERNRVIAELSHHIKNLSASVSEPLENLRHRQGIPENVLEQALRGTGLIRNIVNAMNLSISGSTADFIFDATHLDQKPVTLDSIIWSALISAIPNMFDAKHFSMFQRNYFPTRDAFQSAREAWNAASATEDRELVLECLKNHFFDLSIEATGQSKLVLGDSKGSATKLLILCQEIMMNAVKYASTMDRERRTVRIHTSQETNQVVIGVENSCKTASKLKTSGVGHTIINNFAGLLGCEPEIQKAENSYSLKLAFANFSHMSNQGEHPDDTVC